MKPPSLRTRELRPFGEGRQAALFCYGMSKRLGAPVSFAQLEDQDHDIVARFVADGEVNYVPVQLKEWVPAKLNPSATLESELGKLEKYVDSERLVVAFHLNRDATVDFSSLKIPVLRIGALYFYGATDPTQKEWWLIGNLLKDGPMAHKFTYPLMRSVPTLLTSYRARAGDSSS